MIDDYSNINNYEFKQTIGEGNFAKVKLSIFKPTNEEFAIKIINKKKLKQKMKNTIFRENEIVANLNHPNIIKVLRILENEENFYIIMEHCKKGELFDYIVKKQSLTEREASIFFYQLINGVEYIHSQNIAHRDLKPENLLLTEDKTLKIIDFGLSHPFNGKEFLRTKCGSPSYAAPEIINGNEYDGFKTDIWCCGVILYAMLCGFLPFEGENDKELFKNIVECDPEIPRELSRDSRKLIRKIFIPNPNKRITIEEIKKTEFYLKGKEAYKYKYNNNYDNKYNNKEKNSGLIRELRQRFFEEESIDEEKRDNDDNLITTEEEHNEQNNEQNEENSSIKNDSNPIDDNKYINDNQVFDEKLHNNNERINTYENNERTQIPKFKLQLNNISKYNYIFKLFQRNALKEEFKKIQQKKFENFQKIMRTESNEYKNKINPININFSKNFNNNVNKNDNRVPKLMPIINLRDNIFQIGKNNIFSKIKENKNFNNIIKNYNSKKLLWSKSPKLIQYILDDNNKKNKNISSYKVFYNNSLNKIRNHSNKREDKNNDINLNQINSNKVSLNKESLVGARTIDASINKIDEKGKIKRRGRMNPGSLKNKLINIVSKNVPSNLYCNNLHININTINVNDNRYNNWDQKKYLDEKQKLFKIKDKDENGFVNKTDINYPKKVIPKNQRSLKIEINSQNERNNHNLDHKIAVSLGPHHKMKEGGLLVIRTGNMKKNFGNENLSKNLIKRRGNPKSEENYKIKRHYGNIHLKTGEDNYMNNLEV